jgi:hypothetical protein
MGLRVFSTPYSTINVNFNQGNITMYNNKQFLNEYIAPSVNKASVLYEDTMDGMGNKQKSLHMSGLFIEGDVRNHNGRIYPSHEIKAAVDRLNSIISETGSVCGEADHPDDLQINIDRISHQIIKMWYENANGYGKLKLIPTPLGELVKTLLESGVKLGVSSRGSGNVDENTGKVSDFEIITVDIVVNPSAPSAYPTAIYEGLRNMKGGDSYLNSLRGAPVTEYQNPIVQEYLKETMIKMIKDLKLK